MQPTTEELKKTYESMRDDQIISLLEDEGMRTEAIQILKEIAKKRWLKITNNKDDNKNISPEKSSVKSKELKWIRWWLLIIAFSLWIWTLLNFANLTPILSGLIVWKIPLNYISLFSFITASLFFLFSIFLLVLFTKKSHKFPNFFIAFLIFKIIFSVITYFLFNDTVGWINYGEEIGKNIFLGLIFWLYIIESKRVKNTFIN